MLTHIVWWTLRPEAGGKSAAENAALLKERLEALREKIPSLLDISVGINLLDSSTEDVGLVLVSRHNDADGLTAYVAHPEHKAVGEVLRECVVTRKAIDFLE